MVRARSLAEWNSAVGLLSFVRVDSCLGGLTLVASSESGSGMGVCADGVNLGVVWVCCAAAMTASCEGEANESAVGGFGVNEGVGRVGVSSTGTANRGRTSGSGILIEALAGDGGWAGETSGADTISSSNIALTSASSRSFVGVSM